MLSALYVIGRIMLVPLRYLTIYVCLAILGIRSEISGFLQFSTRLLAWFLKTLDPIMILMLGVNIMRVLVMVCRAVHVRRARNPRESLHCIYPRIRSTYGYLLYKINFLRVVLHVTRLWFGSLGLYNRI